MIQEIITGLNFWLIVIFTGALVWVVRQIVPAHLEKTKWFRALLKVVPVLVGAGMACIPALRPVQDVAQSMLIGFVGGTFSQSAYGILRSLAPEKIKAILGGKTQKE